MSRQPSHIFTEARIPAWSVLALPGGQPLVYLKLGVTKRLKYPRFESLATDAGMVPMDEEVVVVVGRGERNRKRRCVGTEGLAVCEIVHVGNHHEEMDAEVGIKTNLRIWYCRTGGP